MAKATAVLARDVALGKVKLQDKGRAQTKDAVVMGEADLIAILWVSDHEEIATIVTEQIAAMNGVVSTRTSVAYRAYSTNDRNLV